MIENDCVMRFSKQNLKRRLEQILHQFENKSDIKVKSKIVYNGKSKTSFSNDFHQAYVSISMIEIDGFRQRDEVPNWYAAAKITDCFHEMQHVRQRIDNISGIINDTHACEMACDMFVQHAYADFRYDIDTLELDAEIMGLQGARQYCKTVLPSFEYEKAIVESVHVRGHKYLSSNGYNSKRITTFDDLVNALRSIRETIYDKVLEKQDVPDEEKTVFDKTFSSDKTYTSGAQQKADLIDFVIENTDDEDLLNSVVVTKNLHKQLLDDRPIDSVRKSKSVEREQSYAENEVLEELDDVIKLS